MLLSQRMLVVAFAAATLSAGCDAILGHSLNREFCEAHTSDPDCQKAYPDAAPDGPTTCASDQQCSGATPVCDLGAGGSMTCVQCTAAESMACTGGTPVCTGTTCGKCTAHAQCSASSACLPDGSCADTTTVAYVDPAGTDNAMCTKTMPCTKVAKALATNRPYVKFHGTTDEAVTVQGGQVVTFLADPDAELTRTGGNGAILTVQGDGTALSIYDLSISNAPNSSSGVGCVIPAASGAPMFSLVRAQVMNNPGGGIVTSGGTTTITQSTVSGNAGGGVFSTGGTTTVTQSTISGNTGGGISVSGAEYDVSNSFIVSNGGLSSVLGGVAVGGISAAGTHRFVFNTVTNNAGGSTVNAGVACGTVLVPISFSDSVIYGNIASGGAQFGGSANCTSDYSDIGPDSSSGTGNINQDPKFVDVVKQDYHLQTGSPAENAADPASTVSVDFDGDVRPQGGRSDMGADEVNQ